MDNGFIAWLQLGWAWLFRQLTSNWTGISLFLIGSVVIALVLDHLFTRRRTRRQLALRLVEADGDVQDQADLVAASCWREDSGEHEVRS